jgi:hypothetical protein
VAGHRWRFEASLEVRRVSGVWRLLVTDEDVMHPANTRHVRLVPARHVNVWVPPAQGSPLPSTQRVAYYGTLPLLAGWAGLTLCEAGQRVPAAVPLSVLGKLNETDDGQLVPTCVQPLCSDADVRQFVPNGSLVGYYEPPAGTAPPPVGVGAPLPRLRALVQHLPKAAFMQAFDVSDLDQRVWLRLRLPQRRHPHSALRGPAARPWLLRDGAAAQ